EHADGCDAAPQAENDAPIDQAPDPQTALVARALALPGVRPAFGLGLGTARRPRRFFGAARRARRRTLRRLVVRHHPVACRKTEVEARDRKDIDPRLAPSLGLWPSSPHARVPPVVPAHPPGGVVTGR